MSNPFSGIITSDMKTTFTNAIDALLEDSACMVPCRLYYGDTKWTDCPNCYYDSLTKRSSGRYRAGGPMSFTLGICPYCHGLGRKETTETTASIYLMPIWDSKEWVGVNSRDGQRPYTGIPESMLQTMCKFQYYDEITRAKNVLIDTNIEDYTKRFYEKFGEPEPCGFGASSYILQMWLRIDK